MDLLAGPALGPRGCGSMVVEGSCGNPTDVSASDGTSAAAGEVLVVESTTSTFLGSA
jgi:hypothetical protein